jgi:hypothetical protein
MEVNMQTRQIAQSSTDCSILHVSVATGLRYDRLVEAFEGSLGKWDPIAGKPLWEQKASWPDVEAAIAKMAEPFGLMVLAKVDQGRVTSLSGQSKMCSLYLVDAGSPAHGAGHVPRPSSKEMMLEEQGGSAVRSGAPLFQLTLRSYPSQ